MPEPAETTREQDQEAPTNAPAEPNPMAALPKWGEQLAEIAGSLRRLIEVQIDIWLLKVKMTVMRLVLMAVLAFVSLIVALVGVIFLYAGIYHVLTDVWGIPAVWALLIFAAVHLLFAGVLVVAAMAIGRKKADHSKGGSA